MLAFMLATNAIMYFSCLYVVYYCLKKEEIFETWTSNKNCVDFDFSPTIMLF